MENITQEVKEAIFHIQTLDQLEQLRIYYLGKTGIFAQKLAQMKNLSADDRKSFGQKVNTAKQNVELLISQQLAILQDKIFEQKLLSQKTDLSIPANYKQIGKIHPISQALEELVIIFSRLGFNIAQGPNIENDWYNFTALNIPANHPARQMHDTFYLKNISPQTNTKMLLRTHTSPVQIRHMQDNSAPFRFISYGRTYRSDSDATHTPMFHQVEAVCVDKNVHMGHLKELLTKLIRLFFENDAVEVRMRPSFFPFTAPSAEVDIRIPGSSKWLEVLGSGMIHPKVLDNVKIDTQIYSGFALGLGVERLAMLKYGIDDLRDFFDINLNWMKHYGFSCFHKISLEEGLSL